MDGATPNQGGQGSGSESGGGRGGDKPNGHDERGLRELALRLAATRFAGAPWSSPGAEPRLFVGELPAGLPFALPLPDGSRVVGGVQTGSTTTVYVDAGHSPGQVLQFYREGLRAQGWQPLDWPAGRHGGFVPAMSAMANRLTFCRGEEAPALSVSAFELSGAPAGMATSIQVELNTFAENPEYSPCAQQRRMRGPSGRMGPQIVEIFPALVPPAGAQQQPQGGGGGGDRWHTSAELQTDLALAEVRSFYEQQLLDAGWLRDTSGESGPVAWSMWRFDDKEGQPWRALFFILHEPEAQNAYYLFLQARAANRRSPFGGGGGFSYAPLSAGRVIGVHTHGGPELVGGESRAPSQDEQMQAGQPQTGQQQREEQSGGSEPEQQ